MPSLDRLITLLVATWLLLAATATIADDLAETRDALRKMRQETLNQLYRDNPQARNQIRGAAGYGVFEVVGVHILFLGGSGGRGVVKDNLTGKDSYMNMGAVAGGLGVGFQDTRTVLIFKKRKVFKEFLEKGWTFGGDARATAQAEGQGGSVGEFETPEGITVYQLTKTGLNARATVQGTRYWNDPDLN